MKFGFLVIGLFLSVPCSANAESLKTLTSYAEAVALSIEEDKPIIVYFESKVESPATIEFETKVLVDEAFTARLNKEMIFLRIPADYKVAGKLLSTYTGFDKLANRYGVVVLSQPINGQNLVVGVFPFAHLGGAKALDWKTRLRPFEPWTKVGFAAILAPPKDSIESYVQGFQNLPEVVSSIYDPSIIELAKSPNPTESNQ